MTEQELAAIEARAAAATPGPWRALQLAQADAWYCFTNHWEWSDAKAGTYWSRADATFQAHARDDVPALVAEVRRLRAALAPILASWDRETAGCDCRSAATVLHREWMEMARAALDGGGPD